MFSSKSLEDIPDDIQIRPKLQKQLRHFQKRLVPRPGGQTGQCVQHVRTFLGPRLRVQCWLLAWLTPHSAIRCSRCDSIAITVLQAAHTNMFKSKWRGTFWGWEWAGVLLVSRQQNSEFQPHVGRNVAHCQPSNSNSFIWQMQRMTE